MLEVLTVCTGNVARSPLAELVLRARTGGSIQVHSAGTRALIDYPMPAEAGSLAVAHGAPPAEAQAHRGRRLTEGMLRSPDLILAMAREHRRAIVELAPARLRSTFTVREFARLSVHASAADLAAAIGDASDPAERARRAVAHVASLRSAVEPPHDPADDDVIDPFRRSERTYALAAAQLVPAVDEVARVLRVVAG
ncbi:MAG: low molecular weight phosphatase family protein [Microbacterium sp.]|jgi:protein-tyrosine phosphatase|nr:MAG: low molecular weight phosphatase family protein [Microbacterium sp.]